MKRLGLGLVILIAVFFGLRFFSQSQALPQVKVGQAVVNVEIKDTEAGRNLGLSGRPSLPGNQGMLFVFDQPAIYLFWMKGMNFALDFVWIDNDQVVDLTEHVPAPDQTNQVPVTVKPKVPVTQVLEVNSGWISKNGIKVGDEVKHP